MVENNTNPHDVIRNGDWGQYDLEGKRKLLLDYEAEEFEACGRDIDDYRALLEHGCVGVKNMTEEMVDGELTALQCLMDPRTIGQQLAEGDGQ